MIRLLKGDILSFARHYKGPRFHAILCDPPYELSFMNKNWDSTGIAFNPETWAALSEHLLPGAFGMAFASSRGWHRLAVAIEDAGMRIHPVIYCWVNGAGFPKSTRVKRNDIQIDKMIEKCYTLVWQNINSRLVNIAEKLYLKSLGEAGKLMLSKGSVANDVVDFIKSQDQSLLVSIVEESSGAKVATSENTFIVAMNATTNPDEQCSPVHTVVLNFQEYGQQSREIRIIFVPLIVLTNSCGETTIKTKVGEAQMTENGDLQSWHEMDFDAQCVETMNALRHIILNQLENTPNLDTTSQMEKLYATNVIITKSTVASLISSMADIVENNWQGHRYGLQAMKPAAEMIIVFQKPYSGKPVDSIVATGAGAINIDKSRISSSETVGASGRWGFKAESGWNDNNIKSRTQNTYEHTQGRWPANFVLSHVPPQDCQPCRGTGVEWPERAMTNDEWLEYAPVHPCSECDGTGIIVGCVQVGTREVKGSSQERGLEQTQARSWKNQSIAGINRTGYADENGNETIANWRCHESCPVRRLGEQSGERKSAGRYRDVNGAVSIGARGSGPDTTVCYQKGLGWQRDNDYAGDTGTAARFFFQSDWHHEIAERLAQADPVLYQSKASRRERDAGLANQAQRAPGYGYRRGLGDAGEGMFKDRNTHVRNSHPTIKPIELCRWLATLLLPPDAYAPRRILVPFAGTASEMIGAGLAGWEHIVGIELSMENVLIGEARLNHWLYQPQQGALL